MGIPEYIRISDDLKSQIMSQVLNPGDPVQSENQLREHYGVSRMTVRKALTRLVNEEYIHAVAGKGYFVCEPGLEKCELIYDETFSLSGSPDSIDLIDLDVIKPTQMVGIKLEIPKEQPVIMIRRVFKEGGEAIACDVKYIPYHRGIPLLEKELKNSTFPEMVARKNSIFAITKKLRIFAAGAEEDTARLLNAEEGTPLLAVEEFLYDNHDKPVGWGITYMLGERNNLYGEASFK